MRTRRNFIPRIDDVEKRDVPSGLAVPIIVPVTIATAPTALPTPTGGSPTQIVTQVPTTPPGGGLSGSTTPPLRQYGVTNVPGVLTPDQLGLTPGPSNPTQYPIDPLNPHSPTQSTPPTDQQLLGLPPGAPIPTPPDYDVAPTGTGGHAMTV